MNAAPAPAREPKPFFSAADDAEEDMLKVYDLAIIVHHHMSDGPSITKDMQAALSWLTAELVDIGGRLKDHHSALVGRTGR